MAREDNVEDPGYGQDITESDIPESDMMPAAPPSDDVTGEASGSVASQTA